MHEELFNVSHAQAVRLLHEHPAAAYVAFWFAGTAFPISVFVLGVVLTWIRAVPVPIGVLIAVSAIAFPLSRIPREIAIAHIADLALLVPFAYLGARMAMEGARPIGRLTSDNERVMIHPPVLLGVIGMAIQGRPAERTVHVWNHRLIKGGRMTRQGIPGVPTAEKAAIYLKAGACASVAGVLGLIWLPSDAEAARTPTGAWSRPVADHTHDGNGHHNSTALSVGSPIRNRGYQHTTNRNAGGVSDAQNALCRNVRVCRVTQNVTVVNPEGVASPPPSRTDAAAPPPAYAAPALYMGPYGVMLTDQGPAGLRDPGGRVGGPSNVRPTSSRDSSSAGSFDPAVR